MVHSNIPTSKCSIIRQKELPPSLKERPIRVGSLNDARNLLSRLLVAFQREEIASEDARTLSYLVTVYIQVLKDAELEQRISKLEEKTNGIASKTY